MRNLTKDEFNGLASRLLAIIREHEAKGCHGWYVAYAIKEVATNEMLNRAPQL